MVLPFQTQEVARTDVQEAKLPTVLIDVEVRHCPTTVPPESRTLFWRISCWGEAGCSCNSSLNRAKGSPFLLEPADPSTSIMTISAQRFWKGSIHRSAWNKNSPKFAYSSFSEVQHGPVPLPGALGTGHRVFSPKCKH